MRKTSDKGYDCQICFYHLENWSMDQDVAFLDNNINDSNKIICRVCYGIHFQESC